MTPLYLRSLIFSGCCVILFFIFVSKFHHRTIASTYHSTLDRLQGVTHEKLAYATFLAGTVAELDNITITEETFEEDKYFTAARLLGYHLMHKPSTRSQRGIPYLVLVTKNVQEVQVDRLRRDGAIVIPVESQPTGDWFHPTRARWNDVMTKLRLWELEEFDKVVFLDVDSALTKPLDGVFDDAGANIVKTVADPRSPLDPDNESPIPERYLMASVPEAITHHQFPPKDGQFRHGHTYFNAGFFMFSPSSLLHQHYTSLTNHANVTDLKFDTACPEQNLLNYAHRREGPMPWIDLSLTWNVIRATKNDVKNGAVSLHAKWWGAEELQDWFTSEVGRMQGFYQGHDDARWEVENGIEVPVTTRVKRWAERKLFEMRN